MNKEAISVTLSADNLRWIKAQAVAARARSVSEMLDRLIRQARSRRGASLGPSRSVAGTIRISEADPDLSGAEAAIRALFQASLERTRPRPSGNKPPERRRTARRRR